MRVRLEWALYAIQARTGHGWRLGSAGRHSAPAGLDEFTDLAGGSEGQRGWRPYHAGRSFDRLYAFTYTQPEPVATGEREGSVRTRVLLAPVADIIQAADISPILTALQQDHLFVEGAPAIEINLPESPLAVEAAALQIVDTLAAHPALRVVHVGQQDAQEVIAQVWSTLWPQARAAFSFRLHFDPSELAQHPSEPPQLVITPRAHHWSHQTGFAFPSAQHRRLALFQRDHPIADEVLRHSQSGERSHWRSLNNLILDIQDARTQESVATLSAALSTLDVAAVSDEYRQTQKRRLLARLTALIATATAADLVPLTLLNIKDTVVRSALTRWAATALDDPEFSTLLPRLTTEESWVADAIHRGLQRVAPTPARAHTRWQHGPAWDQFEAFRIVFDANWDDVLADTMPHQLPSTILDLAQRRGWWRVFTKLHARCNPQTALENLLDVIPDEARDGALETLQQEWGDVAFVQRATRRPDSRTRPTVQHILIKDPSIFRIMNVDQDLWLSLWAQALPDMPGVWAGTSEPAAVTGSLLNRLRLNRAVPQPILDAIGETEQANLLHEPDRESLWPHLPETFRQKTAHAWLGCPAPEPVEATLLQEILRQVLTTQPTSGAAHLLLLQATGDLRPDLLVQLVALLSQPADDVEAALERTAQQRPALIGQLYATTGRGAPPMLLALYHRFRWHLPPMAQVHVNHELGHPPDEEVWWLALLDVMERAFPDGPTEPWTLVKGKRKHLQTHGSVDEQWKHALDQVRTRRSKLLGPLMLEAGQNLAGSIDTSILWETRPTLTETVEEAGES